MERYARVASLVFGITMLLLSAAVTVETLVRKLFSVSLGGVDELSGYAIAVGAPLGFAVALIDRAHIRINLFYQRMRPRGRGVLDAASVAALAALALFLAFFTVRTVQETQTYQSIAQTPWATPLIYPQAVWLVAMLAFALPALWLLWRMLALALRGRWEDVAREHGPETVEEELRAELEDLKRR
jgi:TRAP-type C4-dicarboxylate transport system permease small subunit